jgi:hypothetical protein
MHRRLILTAQTEAGRGRGGARGRVGWARLQPCGASSVTDGRRGDHNGPTSERLK